MTELQEEIRNCKVLKRGL